MILSKEYQEKLRKFRRNKKAFYSLIVLCLVFLLSLPAELVFNDKPLILNVDGHYFFPFLFTYSEKDLGGTSTLPINNYRSEQFRNFLNGVKPKLTVDETDLFGDDDDDLDEDLDEAKTPEQGPKVAGPTKKDYWFLWAPFVYKYDSNTVNPKSGRVALLSPSAAWPDQHYLGTDQKGKDVLARLVYGFRISMIFGLGLAISGTIVGCILGAVQGFFGGLIDLLGQRLVEIWGSLPRLYLLMILSSFLASQAQLTQTQHYLLLFFILNLTAWMGMATYMRAEFLKARNLDYVKAAKALGASNLTIMRKHILPNSLTPIITFFPFAITGGILSLVSLDFLALGVKYPAPSLGEMLAQGQEKLHAVWIIIPTVVVLTATLTMLTFIGDGVRHAFDPRSHD